MRVQSRKTDISIQKISANHYIVRVKHVTKPIIAQLKALLERIPSKSIALDGMVTADKQQALREVTRILMEKSSVDVTF